MPTGVYRRTAYHKRFLPNPKGCKLSRRVRRNMQKGQRRRFANPAKKRAYYKACHSLKARAKRAKAMTGRKQTVASKAKKSKSLKLFYSNPRNRLRVWLAQNSPAAAAKRRNSHLGHRNSEESKRKMRIAALSFPTQFFNSKPERYVQSVLHKLGVSFEKHKGIPGSQKKYELWHLFDFRIATRKIVIEVDGCYWHACPECFPNAPKRHRNRDRFIDKIVAKCGWKMIRIPEHKIHKGKEYLSRKILAKKLLRWLS
jgi:DNA mismatch endonuclease, patch repair protein